MEQTLIRRRVRRMPDTEALWNLRSALAPQEVLEVAILGKHVRERLVHDFVCRGVQKGRVLIDLGCGGLVEPDRRADPSRLIDLKQWHS
jgi:hypothetical protein